LEVVQAEEKRRKAARTRIATLTSKQRSALARKAIKAGWSKQAKFQ
jgi:hypothetical protein